MIGTEQAAAFFVDDPVRDGKGTRSQRGNRLRAKEPESGTAKRSNEGDQRHAEDST